MSGKNPNNQSTESISHELLTPLNVILGLTQILSNDSKLPPDHLEMLQSIQKAGEDLLSKIQELFDFPETNKEEHFFSQKKVANHDGPVHILIVDDVQVNRFMIKKMLSRFNNITFDEATNAQEAISVIKERIPHIIFMDVYMPEMNGFETIHLIQSKELLNNSIIILMSSDARSFHEDQMNVSKVDGYLQKPIRERKLISLLEQFVTNFAEDYIATEIPKTPLPQPKDMPDENVLKELLRLAQQGAYSEIKQLMENIKTRQSEFMGFVRYIEQMLRKFQFKEIVDWINSRH
ncbi:MAG: hypothetical protein OMM_01187 [Candidatus Magnetoglobus multicellularis str. Araruama]|uniref:histidine kinase n=1 Tax=Candidatus Magnetoglobus multicellularis str. Araruama TaxID=890399 RepID=A0A1V1PE06_9BACT|nr:MAG: hypothetical protein OMM_01187 [Candidatus Magnetoglobus multicellularis str. Araruama]